MVYYIFMDMFSALAEPTRRNILELLATSGQLSSSDISDKFHISSPAISQHLKILREANLVSVEKRAQQRIYSVNLGAIDELEEWIKKMRKTWDERFDALDKILEIEKNKLKGGGKK
jgi:DNA-binding transcriptional ArsR family regulator